MSAIEERDNTVPTLEKICVRAQKGAPVMNLNSCMLKKDIGIEEDFHSGGSIRQISMLSEEAEEEMERSGRQGLCMKKFMGNLITRNLDYCSLHEGTKLKLSDAVIEIIQTGKECFGECMLVQNHSYCPLLKGCAFGKVIRDGEIVPGIIIKKI